MELKDILIQAASNFDVYVDEVEGVVEVAVMLTDACLHNYIRLLIEEQFSQLTFGQYFAAHYSAVNVVQLLNEHRIPVRHVVYKDDGQVDIFNTLEYAKLHAENREMLNTRIEAYLDALNAHGSADYCEFTPIDPTNPVPEVVQCWEQNHRRILDHHGPYEDIEVTAVGHADEVEQDVSIKAQLYSLGKRKRTEDSQSYDKRRRLVAMTASYAGEPRIARIAHEYHQQQKIRQLTKTLYGSTADHQSNVLEGILAADAVSILHFKFQQFETDEERLDWLMPFFTSQKMGYLTYMGAEQCISFLYAALKQQVNNDPEVLRDIHGWLLRCFVSPLASRNRIEKPQLQNEMLYFLCQKILVSEYSQLELVRLLQENEIIPYILHGQQVDLLVTLLGVFTEKTAQDLLAGHLAQLSVVNSKYAYKNAAVCWSDFLASPALAEPTVGYYQQERVFDDRYTDKPLFIRFLLNAMWMADTSILLLDRSINVGEQMLMFTKLLDYLYEGGQYSVIMDEHLTELIQIAIEERKYCSLCVLLYRHTLFLGKANTIENIKRAATLFMRTLALRESGLVELRYTVTVFLNLLEASKEDIYRFCFQAADPGFYFDILRSQPNQVARFMAWLEADFQSQDFTDAQAVAVIELLLEDSVASDDCAEVLISSYDKGLMNPSYLSKLLIHSRAAFAQATLDKLPEFLGPMETADHFDLLTKDECSLFQLLQGEALVIAVREATRACYKMTEHPHLSEYFWQHLLTTSQCNDEQVNEILNLVLNTAAHASQGQWHGEDNSDALLFSDLASRLQNQQEHQQYLEALLEDVDTEPASDNVVEKHQARIRKLMLESTMMKPQTFLTLWNQLSVESRQQWLDAGAFSRIFRRNADESQNNSPIVRHHGGLIKLSGEGVFHSHRLTASMHDKSLWYNDYSVVQALDQLWRDANSHQQAIIATQILGVIDKPLLEQQAGVASPLPALPNQLVAKRLYRLLERMQELLASQEVVDAFASSAAVEANTLAQSRLDSVSSSSSQIFRSLSNADVQTTKQPLEVLPSAMQQDISERITPSRLTRLDTQSSISTSCQESECYISVGCLSEDHSSSDQPPPPTPTLKPARRIASQSTEVRMGHMPSSFFQVITQTQSASGPSSQSGAMPSEQHETRGNQSASRPGSYQQG